jgi:hypothetical protein
MKIVTRTTAIKNLKKNIGKDLRQLAKEHGITTYETGKQNKYNHKLKKTKHEKSSQYKRLLASEPEKCRGDSGTY